MSSDANKRIQELFLSALDRPPEQREQWLVEQCGEDQTLFSEVRLLLEHDNLDNDPLEMGLDEGLEHMPSTVLSDHANGGERSNGELTQMDSELFLSRLSEVGVLSQDEIDALNQTISSGRSSADPRQLASQLVSQGKLTDYQASALLKGQPELLIDKYLILDMLDAGGMGMVFKAIHRPMNRKVAVKMIAQHLLASPEQVKRFQREVRVAATLEHPNIVRSYDADQSRGVHFLVMEYVRGENLARWVQRQGPMSVEQALDCIRQVAKGLHYAQKQGVIHRDIKPGNLMLQNDGLVKVLDLGLASVDESFRLGQQSNVETQDGPTGQSLAGSELTTAGAVLGTVSFMAPEQSLDARKADTRSDVYSLGCTLYYLLVAEAPYHGETVFQVFMQHREGAIPTLREKRPDVPEKIEAVLQKMLAKSPEDRFQSMGELLAEIEDCEVAAPPKKDRQDDNNNAAVVSQRPRKEANASRSAVSREPLSRYHSKARWIALTAVTVALFAGGYWWSQSVFNERNSPPTFADRKLTDRMLPDTGIQHETNPSNAPLPAVPDQLPLYEMIDSGEWEWSEPIDLGPKTKLNRALGYVASFVSRDGTDLLFSTWRGSGDHGYGNADIWKCTRNSIHDHWSELMNLGPSINSAEEESEPHLSSDGLMLFFSAGKDRGGPGEKNLWVTTRDSISSEWRTPELSVIETSDGYTYRACLTEDMLFMVVAGSGRVFQTMRASIDSPWTKPVAMPKNINAIGQRVHNAWVSDDRRVLLFARRPNSSTPKLDMDRNELWMSTRQNRHSDWGDSRKLPFHSTIGEDYAYYCKADRTLYFSAKRSADDRFVSLWASTLVRKESAQYKNESLADLLDSGEYEWGQPVSLVQNLVLPGSSRPRRPDISPDGLTLLFEMREDISQAKNTDIWISKRASLAESWSKPDRFDYPINSQWQESSPHLSADGLTLFFDSENRPGSYMDGRTDLWFSTRPSRDAEWTEPAAFEFNSNGGWESNAHLTSDKLELIFFSNGEIATCSRKTTKDRWSKPTLFIPPTGDKQKLIFSPWISGDGLTLLFEALDDMDADGTANELWLASRTSRVASWGTPKKIQLDMVVSGASYCPAERAIYFNSHVEGRPVLWVSQLVRKAPPSIETRH